MNLKVTLFYKNTCVLKYFTNNENPEFVQSIKNQYLVWLHFLKYVKITWSLNKNYIVLSQNATTLN